MAFLTPWRGVAALVWLVAVVGTMVAWFAGMPQVSGWVQLAALGYIFLLIALIWRNTPAPEVPDRNVTSLGFWPMLALIVAVLALLFAIGLVIHPWTMLAVATGLAGVWAIWRERNSVTVLAVAIALGAGVLCLVLNAAVGRLSGFMTVYLALVPAMLLGGTLLVWRLGLTRVASAEGDWASAIRLFGLGVLLAVPPALLNIGYGAHAGDSWANAIWKPLVALSPGIAEESMARLMLLTLSFFLLGGRRGASAKSALGAAILIAALAHGFAHVSTAELIGPAGAQMLLAGLLFGVPMGLIFVRFGFEAAVAYHFFIDFVRFIAAYIAS